MQIDVRDILASEVGENRFFRVEDEPLELEDVVLQGNANGEIKLYKTNRGLQLGGSMQMVALAQCHRCLRDFEQPLSLSLGAEFSETPEEDQEPITDDGQINLAPLLRQEIILAQPVQSLCKPDCLGLCPVCGEVQIEIHQHA